MKCTVGPCSREPEVEVRFTHEGGLDGSRWWAYCGWHGLRGGRVRWVPWRIAESRSIRA